MAPDATVGSMYGSGPTRSFLGIPACEVLTPLEADAVVLGIPAATPYPSVGSYCAEGPNAIRGVMGQYAAALHHHDFDFGEPLLPPGARVVDAGDLPRDENASVTGLASEKWLPGSWRLGRCRSCLEAMILSRSRC